LRRSPQVFEMALETGMGIYQQLRQTDSILFVCHWEQLCYLNYRNANVPHSLSYRRSIIPGIVGALAVRGNLIKKTVPALEVASTFTEPQ
jgi:hypothetical protein